jgi:aerobic-type carbon monoxide dehydrogenase small subunit (CoxS/CutS family)
MKPDKINSPDWFEIEVDGKSMKARSGQTIAEVLISNAKLTFRKTRNNASRGVYCNMGICYECRMIVNGRPNVRTCITPAFPGCEVKTQRDADLQVPGSEPEKD